MKRSPITRKAPMRKRGESRDSSFLRDARAAALERDNYECQAQVRGLFHVCSGPLHAHHVLPRGRGGLDHPSNLVTVCQVGHETIHSNPTFSYELGLLQRSGDAVCAGCLHIARLHSVTYGTCTFGAFGLECSCARFVEAAA